MPSFEYSSEHKAFVKQCSRCEKVFIGVDSQKESEEIFSKFFPYGPKGDGFHVTCRQCNHAIARKRKGYGDHDIAKMYKEQEGKCAFCCIEICEPETSGYNRGNPLRSCVDHYHKTGWVRGLLCNDCNVMLGHYERVRDRNDLVFIDDFENYLTQTEAA